MQLLKAEDLKAAHIKSIPKLKKPRGNPAGKKKAVRYRRAVCGFDIETTTWTPPGCVDPINFMYIWQFQLGLELTFYGRTWQEFREFVQRLYSYLQGDLLVCYIHNASYEWQYLKGIFEFDPDGVFATDSRKVLKFTLEDTLECRDSLALTNMSLAAFTRKMGVEHGKLSGKEFDYSKIRFPWTELTERELEYCINDVRGLVEAVQAQMDRDGDTLYTIPLTSTGYPRRDMKRVMKAWSHSRLREIQPDYAVYLLLRDCFRGGNTHANRYYVQRIISALDIGCRILSADRVSSYPDVLLNCMFPMGRWKRGEATKENLRNLMRNKYAIMFRCRFTSLRLKSKKWPVPYLTADKGTAHGASIDNGRILSAVTYETALTDVDFRIVLSEYVFEELEITELYFTEYGYLPEPFRAIIRDYYEQKTALKGTTDPFQKMLYDKSKALLNGLYGMLAQDPCKPDLKWNGTEFKPVEEDPAEILRRNTRKASGSYAWGVWCTAWARYRLEEGIMIAGEDDFLYCDTDSVKYIDHGQSWEKYNQRREEDSRKNWACADDQKAHTHYMGVYEADGEYLRFSTLGSKRYAYEDMNGQLHITISGVSKSAAPELGKLENFREGFVFYHPGKTEADYVDIPPEKEIMVDGHRIELSSYVIINETTYELSLSETYKNLLRLISGSAFANRKKRKKENVICK